MVSLHDQMRHHHLHVETPAGLTTTHHTERHAAGYLLMGSDSVVFVEKYLEVAQMWNVMIMILACRPEIKSSVAS